jgi:hypothetical protein
MKLLIIEPDEEVRQAFIDDIKKEHPEAIISMVSCLMKGRPPVERETFEAVSIDLEGSDVLLKKCEDMIARISDIAKRKMEYVKQSIPTDPCSKLTAMVVSLFPFVK